MLTRVLNGVRKHTRDDSVTAEMPLMDAGLDSLSATLLADDLELQIGVALPPTLIFQYSTAHAIAEHVHSKLTLAAPRAMLQQPTALRREAANVLVASTAALWTQGITTELGLAHMAATAFDAATQVPATRWAVEESAVQNPAIKYAACVPNAELFDNRPFGISHAEAVWMDPQQRLLLEKGYTCLHTSGHTKRSLLGSDIGVMVGIQANDFGSIAMSKPVADLPVYAVSGFTSL